MHTVVLATQKGGSGKSTLAIGLALAAKKAGQNVRLIDTDPQGTLSNWQSRRGIAEPMVETIYNVGRIETRLEALARGGVTLVVIDTASGVSATTAAAIRCADLCLIPARPSITDIEACAATLKAVRGWQKPFAFVLNQTPIRGRRIDNAALALGDGAAREMSDVLAQPFIAMRNDHQDALACGLAVSEYAPTGKSAEEIGQLWRWVEARLGATASKPAAFPDASFPLVPVAAQSGETASAPRAGWGDGLAPWDAGL
ncbi:MAG TPA: ParA family protein [Bradyrhizobium sp.]|uniref:ParA family protein n=1 Tax=Bradyrhizobium sp. TaxID=376 RepID=UPI002D7F1A71|nr:ParA family protein [Bradyrhizobium sp.]HET7885510.1 ParA family protein [Bradyrhizobium sp.]